ncbi:hypothetical protein ACP8HZ_04725 [Francisella noatunensis]
MNAEAITRTPINSKISLLIVKNYYDEKKYEDTDVNFAIMGVVSNPETIKKIEQMNQELLICFISQPFCE